MRSLLAIALIPLLGLELPSARAAVLRWDTNAVIPGTAGITPGPNVRLENLNLQFANLAQVNLSNAFFTNSNLTQATFRLSNLLGADLSGTNLTQASLDNTILNTAKFDQANIAGIYCNATLSDGFSFNQIASTASYGNHDLQRIKFYYQNMSDWDLSQQNLSFADLFSVDMSNANLSRANLTSASIRLATLDGVDFSNANLTAFNLSKSSVANARFDGAILNTTKLSELSSLTASQIYSTASYKAGNLEGIDLSFNDLSGWNLRGQNLTNSILDQSSFTEADLSGADTRGASELNTALATMTNTIRPDGLIRGLVLRDTEHLVIRDYDGDFIHPKKHGPIPITVYDRLDIAPNGTLQLNFDADKWDSRISFRPGVPIDIRGKLSLGFNADINPVHQVGRTFDLFNWDGVTRAGQFAIAAQPGTAWDSSELYSKGIVTLLGTSSDTDQDRDVDSGDLLAFLSNWTGADSPNELLTWRDGDGDQDLDIDQADLLILLNHWTGSTSALPVPAVSVERARPVPEPNLMWTAIVLAAVITVRRVGPRGRRAGSPVQ